METPEEIELALERRLVPASLSGEGLASIEATLDELAGEEGESPAPRRWWLGGAAAAVAGLVVVVQMRGPIESAAVASIEPAALVLLEESDRVVAAEEDAALRAEDDGSVHQAWHVRVVNEERFRDVETGLEVQVVHPRDELVLLPVSHF